MTFQRWAVAFLAYSTVLPAVLFCYAPVRKHLRLKWPRVLGTVFVLCAAFAAALSAVQVLVVRDFSFLFLPGLALLYIAYHRTTTLHIPQTASVFLLTCAFSSFLSNFAIIYDALLHPDGVLFDFSPRACLLLLAAYFSFYDLLFVPMAKYGSYILDHLPQSRVWWATALVSAVFFLFNLRMIIQYYSTLHTNKVGVAYISVMSMMFVLLLLLCVGFYFIVNVLVQKAEAEDRNHILEMQEKQYEALQQYLDADAKARHDFRQTIYTLRELSSEQDYAALNEYLSRYTEALPQKDAAEYCREHALNALLNHYVRNAEAHGIRTDILVRLPETLCIDRVDLCSVIGNILENAITACRTVPEDKRFIRLTVSEEQGSELYIAVSNSFGGELHPVNGRYLSTHKGGSGIGLVSIAATAERYGGTAAFSHEGGMFYSNVMLVNQRSE